MITHANAMTPRARRRKAIKRAIAEADNGSICNDTWHRRFEEFLAKAGYRVAKLTSYELNELRQRAAEDDAPVSVALGRGLKQTQKGYGDENRRG